MRVRILCLAALFAGSPAPAWCDEPAKPDLEQASDLIVRKTNAFRKEEGREKLEVDKTLTKTAQDFADYMARTGKYGHTADGRQPWERAKAHGYEYCVVRENIAYQFDPRGFTTEELAKKFFQGWKESEGHRENMLARAVTETGVAIARSEESGYYYAVQLFGRPESKAIEFKITNRSGRELRYRVGDETFALPPRYIRTHRICKPSTKVTILRPGAEGMEDKEVATVTPEDGDRFTVTEGEGGELKVKEG